MLNFKELKEWEKFVLVLLVGFFIIYITSPEPKLIKRYKTITELDNFVYKDKKGNKYKYIKKN